VLNLEVKNANVHFSYAFLLMVFPECALFSFLLQLLVPKYGKEKVTYGISVSILNFHQVGG